MYAYGYRLHADSQMATFAFKFHTVGLDYIEIGLSWDVTCLHFQVVAESGNRHLASGNRQAVGLATDNSTEGLEIYSRPKATPFNLNLTLAL